MEEITYDRLQELLDEIVVCEAFKLHRAVNQVGRLDFFIPYMMNDALECYLILTNGRMTGEYLADYKGEMTADVVETEQGAAVICHQGVENVFTVWFGACFQELKCYRYDQIGHFWIEGQEQWRRLVYIIGTIHDKYNYMGDRVCNELEKELMPLMEFAPFLAMEEHPFTVLESDQFKFRIQFMVSETRRRGTKKGNANPDQSLLNPGFFKKKGNRGMIVKKMDFLS